MPYLDDDPEEDLFPAMAVAALQKAQDAAFASGMPIAWVDGEWLLFRNEWGKTYVIDNLPPLLRLDAGEQATHRFLNVTPQR